MVTDRDDFSKLDLMQYYGGMPVAQLNGLINDQAAIRKNDAAEAAKHTGKNGGLTKPSTYDY